MNYLDFIERKAQLGTNDGFEPLWIPEWLFDFQEHLAEWAIGKGRAALFADCGLGKTPIQLVWAENVVRHTNGRVLILTPLAVGHQTVREAEKFGVECRRSSEGELPARIVVTNYERLHYFNPSDFDGVVCDESSILKNFDGVTRIAITEFMKKTRYRLLCTATAAPNDYIELGTSSEALGAMGFVDMLHRFFKKAESTQSRSDEFRNGNWRFRGHAERDFWRWVCSWSRAIRKPADLGFPDGDFKLPGLTTTEHVVKAVTKNPDALFDMPAMTLEEQREERRRTIGERCEMVARLVSETAKPAVVWCHLNEEGRRLRQAIAGSVEVSGDDADERKEEAFIAFERGEIRVLVTKPTIAGFGLNWQHCAHETFFPSHSFEQWYQAIRRCWRFGQKSPVQVDVVCSEGESGVLANLRRKAEACERMFARLVELMNQELTIKPTRVGTAVTEVPTWLQNRKSLKSTRCTTATVARSRTRSLTGA